MAPGTEVREVSRLHLILTIFRKDLMLFSRDFIFLFLTILGIVTFVTLYWVIPGKVDESISIGVHGAGISSALASIAGEQEEGLEFATYETTDALRSAVEAKEVEVGIDFPIDFFQSVSGGEHVRVSVFVLSSLPAEYADAMSSMVKEIAYAIAGYRLPVTEPSEDLVVLGPDRAGDQVPFRDRMRPLYAFMILIMEAIALGTLISSEVQERTITALLSTPARVGEVLAAKLMLGTLVAFSEAMTITLLIRGFGTSPGIVTVALFLGAVMVTGIAMVAGSAGKEIMGSMLLGVIVLIPLAIPGFAVLFPGEPSVWVRILPSYGVVQAIIASSTEGEGWAESARYLAMLSGWCVASATAGVLVLKRRAQKL